MKTANQIRRRGFRVLAKSLGPVDAIRFIQQFDPGHGDYTADRERILDNAGVDELAEEAGKKRSKR